MWSKHSRTYSINESSAYSISCDSVTPFFNMTFFETDAYLILADIWCSNFSNYWALFLMISFIATIILYKAAHRDEQEIVINVKNRHELENAQLGYIDVMENGQIHRFAIIPSKDGLPLYIRFFLDTVTEPL